MFLFYLIVFVLSAFGLYKLSAAIYRFPSKANKKAIDALNGKKSIEEKVIYPFGRKLMKIIRLGPYHKRKLQKQLDAAGIKFTPEQFVANALVFATYPLIIGLVFLLFIPLTPFAAIITAALFIVAIFMFRYMIRSAKDAVKERQADIDLGMPKLCDSLIQCTHEHKDIYEVIKAYRDSLNGEENKALCKELDTLKTDMSTGNREIAITAFKLRNNSQMVSLLADGLIGLERGNDMQGYFIDAKKRMEDYERQRLNLEAVKRPGMFTVPTVLVMLASIAVFFTVLLIQGYNGFSDFF